MDAKQTLHYIFRVADSGMDLADYIRRNDRMDPRQVFFIKQSLKLHHQANRINNNLQNISYDSKENNYFGYGFDQETGMPIPGYQDFRKRRNQYRTTLKFLKMLKKEADQFMNTLNEYQQTQQF